MLECARTFQNYRVIVALGQNILRQYRRAKEKRRYMYRAIENESDVVSYNTRPAFQGDAIIIL